MYASLPSDTVKDFSGVSPLASLPNVLIVNPGKGYKTVQDLVDKAKANPGAFNYGSAGVGSATHMNAEIFRNAAKFDAVHVPYKGTPEAMTEVAAGRLDFFFAPLSSALPLIKDGRLQALAVGTAQRSPLLPNVPTTVEAGFPRSEYVFWVALLAPSGTPRPIVDQLNAEATKALSSPEVKEKLAALGAEFLERTRVQRKTGKPFYIDKLPNNWAYAGFIHLILPHAKLIDARRHPLDCCFSNFRQHFARGQAFTYDLEHVGLYYADYVRLMAHVDAVLPGRVHRVIYERMVDDTEVQVRALLDYCGLEFEPACLEFYKTERAVRTASSEQVRQPIYRDATEEWRAYDAHLGPLREALGPVLAAYPGASAS
jgi:hypothetical protein